MSRFFKNSGPFFLQDIAKELHLEVVLDGQRLQNIPEIALGDIATLEKANADSISFFSNKKYLDQFQNTKARVCITSEKYISYAPKSTILIISENPYVSFAKISHKFYDTKPQLEDAIANSAYISPSAKLGKNVKIFPNVYVGDKVEIGDNCIIHHSATLQNCIIGENTIIHAGVRIGQDGFGYAFDKGSYIKVPQIGGVTIGKNVEIGANTTIDRGTIENTEIGDMCKIDNLVQIGHNVKLGVGCIIVSQVGISGSTEIGNYVQIGGQAGLAGHLKIGDKAQIGAQSGILKDIEPETVCMGTPALPIKQFFRNFTALKKIANKG